MVKSTTEPADDRRLSLQLATTIGMERLPITILLVEDDDVSAEMVCRSFARLDKPPRVIHERMLQRATGRLGEVDAICLDLGLPGFEGAEAVRYLRERTDRPICVISERDEAKTIWDSLEAGAQMFQPKSGSAQSLSAVCTCLVYHALLAAKRRREVSLAADRVHRCCEKLQQGPNGEPPHG